ncbi:hypothetical protein AB0D04_18880 [Streptomyces sp. NPDC048483]|uniref:TRAFAC clade GTPase domain-containing protein n=1 Tax=Streptomyces sp. NPDC048483 TaxID=3154927 RepID=UPI0034389AE0
MYLFLGIFYLAGLGPFVAVAPLIAVGRALGLTGELLGRYGRLLIGVLRRRTPEFVTLPPFRPQDEPQPAHRQYFFGPALRDLRQLNTLARRLYVRTVGDGFRSVTLHQFTRPTQSRFLTVPFGLTLYAGLALGAVLVVPFLAVALLLHGLLIAVLHAAARLAASLLRALDVAALWTRALHNGMLCPHCFERVPYPAYECRNASCRRRHTDIRPGRYGIVRRRCQCRTKLPTLLMLMPKKRRLEAHCTFCAKPMGQDAGHLAETVLPLIGGRAAGKTQLMAAMLMSLDSGEGSALRAADEDTRGNYEILREVLEIQGHTRSTQRALPRAYSVILTQGRTERLLHVFDTAGERFTHREDIDALGYVRAAHTFLFVLDPLAVPAFWEGPGAGRHSTVDRALASSVHPELVFQQTVQAMLQMDAPLKQSRLAVAISKTDLLHTESLPEGSPDDRPGDGFGNSGPDDSDRARDWLIKELQLGNLVRAMTHNFREVRFFFTAAVTVEERRVHDSMTPFVTWCLHEGRG